MMTNTAFDAENMPEFGIKGFRITFENDVTVSVIFGKDGIGPGSYSDGGQTTCETSVWRGEGQNIEMLHPPNSGQGVQGWQTPAQLLKTLNWAEAQ